MSSSAYRRDTDHREEFAHPDDSDYQGLGGSANSDSDKQPCRYGAACFL
jgi:hypothetical protein